MMKFFKRFLRNQNKNIEKSRTENRENFVASENKSSYEYYSLAVSNHQNGNDNFEMLQQSAKASLDEFNQSNLVMKVEIVGCSDSCDNCKKLNGKIISIAEAYSELPIPCRECTHSIGFCRCFYSAVPCRDEEGMLILK